MQTEVNSTSTLTTRSVGVRFGLIGAVCSVAYFLVLSVAGINMASGAWSWIGYGITLLIVVFAHKYYKDNNIETQSVAIDDRRVAHGFMSYGQGVGIAFWIGLVSGIISSIFTYLYIKFVDTSFIDMVKEQQIETFQKQGMSDQQIDQAMKVAANFTTPEMMLIMGLLGSIIVTVIIGVIVSIFTQKKNPEPAF
ncbi:MAG TPA: DUF4199 domain-containing protein [Chryseosolibacter sp.]|nr:DUF4199 domain-containing protein [Chryseosolibacter sp.]